MRIHHFSIAESIIRLRALLSGAAAALCILTATAVSPYPTLEAKATRFFDHSEWASASAIYDLMLEERPAVAQTYGKAIVANGMQGLPQEQSRLMAQALDNHIPFDSVFSDVKEWSFHIGHPELFENFLINTRSAHPWMQRTINGYLLKYYTFRSNGPGMVEYARIMLDGAPANISFLTTLAEGYMLTGETDEGLATYRRIITADPDNYNALVTAGNWLAGQRDDGDNASQALALLKRAYSLRPTPYVAALIDSLSQRHDKR